VKLFRIAPRGLKGLAAGAKQNHRLSLQELSLKVSDGANREDGIAAAPLPEGEAAGAPARRPQAGLEHPLADAHSRSCRRSALPVLADHSTERGCGSFSFGQAARSMADRQRAKTLGIHLAQTAQYDDAAAIAWAQNVADALHKRGALGSVVVIMHEDGLEIARIQALQVLEPLSYATYSIRDSLHSGCVIEAGGRVLGRAWPDVRGAHREA
jgi:hypothetical protein